MNEHHELYAIILSLLLPLCHNAYNPVLSSEKGRYTWELPDRFCHGDPPRGRTTCILTYSQRKSGHRRNIYEAQHFCEQMFNGHLPRPRILEDLTHIKNLSSGAIFIDAFLERGSIDGFRYSDNSIVPLKYFKSKNWKIQTFTNGSCLSANPGSQYDVIDRTECTSKEIDHICEWCLPKVVQLEWENCGSRKPCLCKNGTYACQSSCDPVECISVSFARHNCRLDPCPYNRFGDDCRFQCHCGNYQPCDVTTGSCAYYTCLEGWLGPACNLTTCPPWKGGKDCATSCYCDNNQQCDPHSAYCHTGCAPGVDGLICNRTKCPVGHYFIRCEKTCMCPTPDEPCHPEHGQCVSSYCDTKDGSCPKRKNNLDQKRKYEEKEDTEEHTIVNEEKVEVFSSLTLYLPFILGGVLGCIVTFLSCVVFAFWIARKRKAKYTVADLRQLKQDLVNSPGHQTLMMLAQPIGHIRPPSDSDHTEVTDTSAFTEMTLESNHTGTSFASSL